MTLNPVQAQQMALKGFIPLADAARLAGHAASTLYRLAEDGNITYARAGKRWYVAVDSLLRYRKKQDNSPQYLRTLEKALNDRVAELRDVELTAPA